MLPSIRGSYLALRIGFRDDIRPAAVYALCLMPYALCLLPYALCPARWQWTISGRCRLLDSPGVFLVNYAVPVTLCSQSLVNYAVPVTLCSQSLVNYAVPVTLDSQSLVNYIVPVPLGGSTFVNYALPVTLCSQVQDVPVPPAPQLGGGTLKTLC